MNDGYFRRDRGPLPYSIITQSSDKGTGDLTGRGEACGPLNLNIHKHLQDCWQAHQNHAFSLYTWARFLGEQNAG
jgi:hypothetical protein